MHKKRKLAALIGAGLSPLLVLGLSVTPASAHGYITDPASRQAQCAAGVVECGSIKYEPQSVEGPKGLQDCAGGHDEWAELRDDNHGWNVANVGKSATFNWNLTAAHRTTTWQYYIDGQKIAEFDQGGQQPRRSCRTTWTSAASPASRPSSPSGTSPTRRTRSTPASM